MTSAITPLISSSTELSKHSCLQREAIKALAFEVHRQGIPVEAIARVLDYRDPLHVKRWFVRGNIPHSLNMEFKDAEQKLLKLLTAHKEIEDQIISLLLTGMKHLNKLTRELELKPAEVRIYLKNMEERGLIHRNSTYPRYYLLKKGFEKAQWLSSIKTNGIKRKLPAKEREYIKKLTPNEQLTFYSLVSRHKFRTIEERNYERTTTGKAYRAYCKIAPQLDMQPVTYRQFSNHISKLQDMGLIQTKLISLGRRGRTTSIRLMVMPDETFIQALLEDMRSWYNKPEFDKICEICSGPYNTSDPSSFICSNCQARGFDEDQQRRELANEIRQAGILPAARVKT